MKWFPKLVGWYLVVLLGECYWLFAWKAMPCYCEKLGKSSTDFWCWSRKQFFDHLADSIWNETPWNGFNAHLKNGGIVEVKATLAKD